MKRLVLPRVMIGGWLLILVQVTFAATQVTIDELSDLQFGQIPPTSGTQVRTANFCVALDANSLYRITAVGSGIGGDFSLQNSSNYAVGDLRYQVFANDRRRGLGRELQPSIPLSGLRGKRTRRNQRCPRPRGRVSVRITSDTLVSARPGRYRGTLTLTVVPE